MISTRRPVLQRSPTSTRRRVSANNGPIAEGSSGTVTFTDQADASPVDFAAGLHLQLRLRQRRHLRGDRLDERLGDRSGDLPGRRPGQPHASAAGSSTRTAASPTTPRPSRSPTSPRRRVSANNGPIAEGSTGTVTFSDQADPSPGRLAAGFSYSYDFDNDGTFEVTDSTSDSATVPATYLADGPGSRTVRGRIIDKDGGFTDYTTTITITNVAPTASLGQQRPGRRGQHRDGDVHRQADASAGRTAAGFRTATTSTTTAPSR